MLIIRCPQCHMQYDVGPIAEEAIEYRLERPNNPALKVACPNCGQCLRLPEQTRVPSDQIPANELREMMGRSLLLDHDGLQQSIPDSPVIQTEVDERNQNDRRAPRGDHTGGLVVGLFMIVILVVAMVALGVVFVRKNHRTQPQLEQPKPILAHNPPSLKKVDAFEEMRIKHFKKKVEFKAERDRRMEEIQKRLKDDSDSEYQFKAFITDIHNGKFENAYQTLSDNLKKSFPDIDSFESYLTEHHSFKKNPHFHVSRMSSDDKNLREFQATIVSFEEGEFYRYHIVVIKVGSAWKVDQIERSDGIR
ncbi:MAG: hypothetical protein U0798_21035 [Gemmataceae bacterium]